MVSTTAADIAVTTVSSYFTKDGQHGVCVFRRRQTNEHGHRGYRLTSVGILLAKSSRPKPWRHIAALKALVTQIYSSLEMSGVLQPTESDWEPARAFFEDRKVRRADLSGAGDWLGWSHELDQVRFLSKDFYSRRTMWLRSSCFPPRMIQTSHISTLLYTYPIYCELSDPPP